MGVKPKGTQTMRNYTFYNRNTGSTKTVRVFYAYEAFNKCKSERGWELLRVSALNEA